jgi:hypothetical protein
MLDLNQRPPPEERGAPGPRSGKSGGSEITPGSSGTGFSAYLSGGGTRIRTGDTMIFRSVRDPTVNRHRAPWAVSKRFLEGTDNRGPPPNSAGRHAVVVGLGWAQRVPDRRLRPRVGTARHVRILSCRGVGGEHCPQAPSARVAAIGQSFGPGGGTLTQLALNSLASTYFLVGTIGVSSPPWIDVHCAAG